MTDKHAPNVWAPAKYTPADVAAVQALVRGMADAEQQKRAINWLMYNLTLAYDLEYRTDPRDHAFASGRRFVGLQIQTILRIDTAKLRENAG